jgi:hypothetical protein
MGEKNRFLRAALAYAAAAWPVYAVAERSKIPRRGSRGVLDATTDTATLTRWWTETPEANVGLAIPRGLLVVDIDGREGPDELETLERRFGVLPETRSVISGSGAAHRYFTVAADFLARRTLGAAFAHVECKGYGSSVNLPPSIHPTTGREYLWDGLAGFAAPIAELPAAWAEAIRRKRAPPANPEAAAANSHGAGDDERKAELGPMLAGCSWLRHTRDDAAELREPEWYAMLGLVGRTRAGKQAAHEFSAPHRSYQRAATEKKLQHALTDAGPATCAFIAEELGQFDTHCAHCAHWRKIESPITLGRKTKRRAEPWRHAAADWARPIQLTERGKPYPNLANAAHVLRAHPALAGVFAFDTFRERVTIRAGAPDELPAGELDERRVLAVTRFLQRELAPSLAESAARSALELAAREQPVHVLRERLAAVAWDGTLRLRNRFFERYFGAVAVAKHTFSEDQALYWDTAAVVWFVAMLARLMRPGVPAEYILVVETPAAGSARRAFEILAGGAAYFATQLPARLDWSGAAAAEALRGAWLAELVDLGALAHEPARQFLTRRSDEVAYRYQTAYGRQQKRTVERSCLFVATTGEAQYLADESAARLVLPIRAGAIATASLQQDYPQLMAEARALWERGAHAWFERDQLAILKREQYARLLADPWADKIAQYAREHPEVIISAVFDHLQIPFHLQTPALERRAQRVLLRAGFRLGENEDGRPVWRNPDAPAPAARAGLLQ